MSTNKTISNEPSFTTESGFEMWDITQTDKEILSSILEEKGEIVYYNPDINYIYEISETDQGEDNVRGEEYFNYMINVYEYNCSLDKLKELDFDDLADIESNEVEDVDGGLCTGSPSDAITFFEVSITQEQADDGGSGVVKEYHENGNLWFEIPYKNDLIDGVKKVYHEDGTLGYEIPYKDGLINGVVKTYHCDDVVKDETPYKDGVKQGIAKDYYISGILHAEIQYDNDKKHGEAHFYDTNGFYDKSCFYEHGKEIHFNSFEEMTEYRIKMNNATENIETKAPKIHKNK